MLFEGRLIYTSSDTILNVVASTELGHALVSILKDLGWRGEDNADKVGALEDRAGQAHHRLLTEQLLGEDNVVGNVLELGNVD